MTEIRSPMTDFRRQPTRAKNSTAGAKVQARAKS